MLSMEFATSAEAQGFLDEPMLKQSWDISGAGQSWILEEVEAVVYRFGLRLRRAQGSFRNGIQERRAERTQD
jgi:hypothetical protein